MSASARSQTLMPNLSGFIGMYCLKESLPLNFTRPSSTVMFLPGVYTSANLCSKQVTSGQTLQMRSFRSSVVRLARCKCFPRVMKRCFGIVSLKPSTPKNSSESQNVNSRGSSWFPMRMFSPGYAGCLPFTEKFWKFWLGCKW